MSRIDENLHRILKDHGLTEYEIKTYLKLVFDGPATPFEISESVQIPYARVYGTLEGLEKRRWIRARPGRPVVYEANPRRRQDRLQDRRDSIDREDASLPPIRDSYPQGRRGSSVTIESGSGKRSIRKNSLVRQPPLRRSEEPVTIFR